MNKLLLTLTFFICAFTAFAQVTFEPGYFIDNEGRRVDCLIKNEDRVANPTQFEYKLTQDAAVNTATLSDVQEFEVLNTVHKYQRYTVNIDTSSDKAKELSYSREPEFVQQQVFLRVLVEGKASLYAYIEKGGAPQFFIKVGDADVEQLIYRKYLIGEHSVQENIAYKQQLWMSLKCGDLSLEQFEMLPYTSAQLVKTFVKHNACAGGEFIDMTKKKQKGKFGFTVEVGANTSTLEIRQYKPYGFTNTFAHKTFPILGLEAEYFLPVNKYKWSVIFEPAFHYYQAEGNYVYYYSSGNTRFKRIGESKGQLSVNYSHVSLPVGIRRYFFLNNSAIFINTALGLNLILNEDDAFKIELASGSRKIPLQVSSYQPNVIIGLGYSFRNRYIFEAKYDIGKVVMKDETRISKFSNSVSFTLGYKII